MNNDSDAKDKSQNILTVLNALKQVSVLKPSNLVTVLLLLLRVLPYEMEFQKKQLESYKTSIVKDQQLKKLILDVENMQELQLLPPEQLEQLGLQLEQIKPEQLLQLKVEPKQLEQLFMMPSELSQQDQFKLELRTKHHLPLFLIFRQLQQEYMELKLMYPES
jgi:hypothetical protein